VSRDLGARAQDLASWLGIVAKELGIELEQVDYFALDGAEAKTIKLLEKDMACTDEIAA
tara:strand:+ start:373 stop:549 length:177 start_codon:yes stop_codon:yes gene_type:complete